MVHLGICPPSNARCSSASPTRPLVGVFLFPFRLVRTVPSLYQPSHLLFPRVLMNQEPQSQFHCSLNGRPSIGTGAYTSALRHPSLGALSRLSNGGSPVEREGGAERCRPSHFCLLPSLSPITKPFRLGQSGGFRLLDDRRYVGPARSCRQPWPGRPRAWCPRS